MFEAFILAGGNSTRMGREKSSLEVGGLPMLERVAGAIRDAGAVRLSVVSSKGTMDGFETVPDIYRGKGALGGIHSALKHSAAEAVFITGCDFPFLSGEFVRHLVDIFNRSSDCCVVPEQPDGVPQPLAAVYSRDRCLPHCESLLSGKGSFAVKALLDRVHARVVSFEEYSALRNAGNILLNVNTPDEVETAKRLVTDVRV